MAVRITGRYLGNKKVELSHEPSGAKITTAAPVDNEGDGSSFSPTDLAAASLGACMLTIMANIADRNGIDLGGASMRLEKEMSENPRRIAAIPVVITLPASISETERKKLERGALACPVHKSLDPNTSIEVNFVYK